MFCAASLPDLGRYRMHVTASRCVSALLSTCTTLHSPLVARIVMMPSEQPEARCEPSMLNRHVSTSAVCLRTT